MEPVTGTPEDPKRILSCTTFSNLRRISMRVKFKPTFDPVRSDPWYLDVISRLRLPARAEAAWREWACTSGIVHSTFLALLWAVYALVRGHE